MIATGTQTWVVYCWLRHSVTIVGVFTSEADAEQGRLDFIDAHPDPEWEKASHERKNNTLIEMKIAK